MKPKDTARKKRLEGKIRKISREIEQIEGLVYEGPHGDLDSQHFLLQQKRNHAIRGIVLELQLALEDLIDVWLKSFFLGCKPHQLRSGQRRNPKLSRAIDQLLEGSGSVSFERKLELAEGTRLIRRKVRRRLSELYSIRNRCSHNWLLDLPIRRKIRRNQPKRRLLEYKNKNLFEMGVVEDFVKEFGSMYYRLFNKVYASL